MLPLANVTDLLTPVLRTITSGWVRITLLFFAVCGPKFTRLRRGRDSSLQRRFPVVDILFRSGDIRDRIAKSSEIALKSMFFGPKSFGGGRQILDAVFKIAPISDHVAKFCGDRPRDRGDLALKKKKETAVKHKGRVALSQRSVLKTESSCRR